jgi:ABC-type antimicrobial peptide transport system permease subunit
VRLVLASTAIMLSIGAAFGLGLSIALNQVLTSWTGGSSRDPFTLLASAALLFFVAVIACIVPAWRAATVDPVRALRTE